MNNLPTPYQAATLVFLFLFAVYDCRHHKVRNTALLAFLPWCLASMPMTAFYTQVPAGYMLLQGLFGFLSGGSLLLTASLLTSGGIGGGDIKLTAMLGILYGSNNILLIIVIASLTAFLLYGTKAVFFHRKMQRIPFVPFLFIGSLFAALLTLHK